MHIFSFMKKKLMAMPLGSKIKELRKSLGLKQSNIAAESKETNWPIKQRSYEKAESGLDEIGHDLFEKIAKFFNYHSAAIGQKQLINITAADICTVKNKIQKGKSKKNDTLIHQVYINRISNISQIQAISQNVDSKYIDYKFNPNKKENELIKELLKKIQILCLNKQKEKQYNVDSFFKLDTDFKQLDDLTQVGQTLDNLEKCGITLYAGNIEISNLNTFVHSQEDTLDGDGSGDNIKQIRDSIEKYSIKKSEEIYIILCFQKNSYSKSMTFKYENEFNKNSLDQIIKEYELSFLDKNVSDDENQVMQILLSDFGYSDSINRKNVSISDDNYDRKVKKYYEKINSKQVEFSKTGEL